MKDAFGKELNANDEVIYSIVANFYVLGTIVKFQDECKSCSKGRCFEERVVVKITKKSIGGYGVGKNVIINARNVVKL